MGVVLAGVATPRAAWAEGERCLNPASPDGQRTLSLPNRTLKVPDGCCLIATDTGGQITCGGTTAITWSVFPSSKEAMSVLDKLVSSYRNRFYARSGERFAVPCAILGVETSCNEFTTEVIPGPPQPLRVIMGATEVNGQGVLGVCEYYVGAGIPAVCRQVFTP